MTRPTTHWSLAGDLHAGAVDGCWWCEGEAATRSADGHVDLMNALGVAIDAARADTLRARIARLEGRTDGEGEGEKAPQRPVAAPDGDLRGAAVRADVSDRDRPAERRTAIQGGHLCRHGLYRHEHWCDDHDDHAQEDEK